MFPHCPVGRKFNMVREKMHQLEGESIEQYTARLRRKFLYLEAASGWQCVSEFDSCAHCPRGREAFIDAVWEQFPYWQRSDLVALVASLTQNGPGRKLPNWCDVGHQVNLVSVAEGLSPGRKQDLAGLIAGEHSCLEMESCAHCPRGQGGFEDLLLQLSEEGMTKELHEQLLGG